MLSCAHQTSLNYVCSGAATWTNSATVNQLVYHSGGYMRVLSLFLSLFFCSFDSFLLCSLSVSFQKRFIVIITLFCYFSADTFPNRFHFTITNIYISMEWVNEDFLINPLARKHTHTFDGRELTNERWIKSERVQINSTEKQTNHPKLDKETCNALKSCAMLSLSVYLSVSVFPLKQFSSRKIAAATF